MEPRTIHSLVLALGLWAATVYWPVVPDDPSARRPDGSEPPLHWSLGWRDSVGTLPADRFLFLPNDRVWPGPANGSVPGGEYGATLDSAVARGLVFRETAVLLAARFSRHQQLQAAFALHEALEEPELLDSLRETRESTVQRLEGAKPLWGQGPEVRLRMLTVRDAALLRALPLSAWYDLSALGNVRAGKGGVPRFFLADVHEMLQHAAGKGDLPEQLGREVFADTTLTFATRLEYSRCVTRAANRALHGLPPSEAPERFAGRLAAELRPAYELLQRDRRLPSRYHWFDDPGAPGNPMH